MRPEECGQGQPIGPSRLEVTLAQNEEIPDHRSVFLRLPFRTRTSSEGLGQPKVKLEVLDKGGP
jgi:hypothetical protein